MRIDRHDKHMHTGIACHPCHPRSWYSAVACLAGLLLPVLGALPDALIIVMSGAFASPEEAQEQVIPLLTCRRSTYANMPVSTTLPRNSLSDGQLLIRVRFGALNAGVEHVRPCDLGLTRVGAVPEPELGSMHVKHARQDPDQDSCAV